MKALPQSHGEREPSLLEVQNVEGFEMWSSTFDVKAAATTIPFGSDQRFGHARCKPQMQLSAVFSPY